MDGIEAARSNWDDERCNDTDRPQFAPRPERLANPEPVTPIRSGLPDATAPRSTTPDSTAASATVSNGAQLVEELSGIATELRRVESALVAAVARILPECETTDLRVNLASAHGYRNVAALVEGVTGLSAATARGIIAVAKKSVPGVTLTGQALPAMFDQVGQAMRAGELGLESARAIVSALSPVAERAHPTEFAVAEASLVDMATGRITEGPGAGVRHSCDLLKTAAVVWRNRIDPDGIEPDATYAHKNRGLWVSRTARRGLHQVRGQIPADVALRFHAARDAVMKHASSASVDPCPIGDSAAHSHNPPAGIGEATRDDAISSSDAIPDNSGTSTSDSTAASDSTTTADNTSTAEAQASDERRTSDQIGADLFAAMLTALAASNTFAAPPAVLVTIDGQIDGDGGASPTARTGTMQDQQIARSIVDQMACDAGTQPVWLQHGKILALGSSGRFFTTNQRRAIAARDGHTCLIRGCAIPASACEAHHVTPAAEGGSTHVDNGVLLCWHHHRMMDLNYWTVTMRDGVPRVTHIPIRPAQYHPRM